MLSDNEAWQGWEDQNNPQRKPKVVAFRPIDTDDELFARLQARADRIAARRLQLKRGQRLFKTLAIGVGAAATILAFGWWQWVNVPPQGRESVADTQVRTAKLNWLSERRNWLEYVFTIDFKEPTAAGFEPGYLQQLIANIGTERLTEARERQKDANSACSSVELTTCLLILELQEVDRAILLEAQTGTQFILSKQGAGSAQQRSAKLATVINNVIVANKGKLNQKALVDAVSKEVATWEELKVEPVRDLSQSETTLLAIAMKLGYDSTTLGWQPVFPTDPYRFNALQRQTQASLSNLYALQDRTDAAAAISNINAIIAEFEKQRGKK
ncbi:MAG: hypothetical protein LRZ84_07650 [Desertifilum sp.]|nr:hypothetical protein [Desertifilum sp.]